MTSLRHPAGGRLVSLAAFTAVLFVGGCSKPQTVTGKVTYKGTPLNSGTVMFVGQKSYSSPIGSDGGYTIKAPAGKYTITVSTPTAGSTTVPAGAGMMDPS